ncbi:GNAT family N-acetyltransferase [Chitinophaga solisilvae]|uniref:GNAT family N-acetyltransferase n=1 Tax=Chitinophaga solisilvae TaxID=1233460 RepID=A0A9Q5DF90_9BACT|nr:GNAT family N-acetyltransferase [Chitinophaga solisilvae]NSL91227.1 GNAT family N-acetyltransferase [Chitinophaga solisilvae]
MNEELTTARLAIQPVTIHDAPFIFELVNTTEWKTFIGDRNVQNLQDAGNYIRQIISNPDINYNVVRLQHNQLPVGVVTFIKRTYLPHHDIGFAFLPAYAGQGLAFEAASAYLSRLRQENFYQPILATTIPENIRSIRLLEKLGLQFSESVRLNNEDVLLYELLPGKP